METLVVVEHGHHKNHLQYPGKSRGHNLTNFGSIGSAPSSNFRGINCGTCVSGAGLLPTPLKACSTTTPFTKKAYSVSPQTPLASVNGNQNNLKSTSRTSITPIPIKFVNKERDIPVNGCWTAPAAIYEGNQKSLRKTLKSITSPIPIKIGFESKEFRFYERWAGPAYSSSPPPSSLPMPKFSLGPKRTSSLDLPNSASKFDFHPFAKSAPASPTKEHSLSPCELFDSSPDSVTKILCRILNLDLTDK